MQIYKFYSKQRGAALIVSLVLLALLTLLAVSGFQSTLLQERMVGSMRDRQLALQAAEAALREAESLIRDAPKTEDATCNAIDPSCVAINDADGLIRKDADNKEITEIEYWKSEAAWSQASKYDGLISSTTSQGGVGDPNKPVYPNEALYVIERLPRDYSCVSGSVCMEEKIKLNNPAHIPNDDVVELRDFRITVKAWGGRAMDDGAEVILQSIYRRVYETEDPAE